MRVCVRACVLVFVSFQIHKDFQAVLFVAGVVCLILCVGRTLLGIVLVLASEFLFCQCASLT